MPQSCVSVLVPNPPENQLHKLFNLRRGQGKIAVQHCDLAGDLFNVKWHHASLLASLQTLVAKLQHFHGDTALRGA
jgi:hypothetical protein